jgi:hypothetical protein
MNDVSYQEDACTMDCKCESVKGIDHDCNFQCQSSPNCAKIRSFEMAIT